MTDIVSQRLMVCGLGKVKCVGDKRDHHCMYLDKLSCIRSDEATLHCIAMMRSFIMTA